jgi:hypothetical protein
MIVEDLETADPRGRLDVLGYRAIEHVTKHLENMYGVAGIWDAMKPHVNKAMSEGLGRVKLPVEAKVLMSIIQANKGKFLGDGRAK